MSLGNNIKKYRHDLGITQEELASILCITSQAVSKWESGAGLPDVTQIVPLAQALNVSTDALFGFATESYEHKLADEVWFEATKLRDSGEPAQGALAAAEFLDQKCEENIFNYGIMTRYVQAIAHMSRFVNQHNSYYKALLEDNQKRWKYLVKSAENRALQVIRYSDEKELSEECHYALAWLYWHLQEFEKGREHIDALPSIKSNMLKEPLLPYYSFAEADEEGINGWKMQVRDNYQNFIRALNKQIVYAAEGLMWSGSLRDVEENCHWGLSIMDKFMENDRMKAHCQGYYRDTAKFLVAAYLRNNKPDKAAEEWKKLSAKIEEYLQFCDGINSVDRAQVICDYGEKAAENMRHYTRDWIESKKQFILGQLKGWCDETVFVEFEKQIL